jgi:thioredoxin-like negative regulator of GroEL
VRAAPPVELRQAIYTPAPRAAGLAARGFRALDAGQLDAAENLFQGALTADPRDANALGGLGLVRLKAERFKEAADLLGRASAGSKDGRWAAAQASAAFYAALKEAETARDAGRFDAAETLAGPLARSSFKDHGLAAELLADLGRRRAQGEAADAVAAWRAGDLRRAGQGFQRAIADAPQAPWTRYRYAAFLGGAHRPDEADAVMRPVAADTSADARFALALYLDGAGRPGAAAETLDAVPAADRSADMRRFDRQLRCELAVRAGRALGQAGRSRAAIAGLRRLAEETDLPNAAVSQLADGLFELGDEASALSLVQRASAAEVTAPRDYEGAVSVLARAGKPAEAQALIARLATASQEPGAPAELKRLRARAALGTADRFSRHGDFPEAIRVLKAQLAETLDDPELLGALGRAYVASGRPDRGLQVFDALSKLRPKEEGAWLGLASAATGMRDFEAARQALARARQLAPDDPAIALAEAELSQAAGDEPAALSDLRFVLSAHERLRGGDLSGVLDPVVYVRTRQSFDLTPAGASGDDPAGDRLRERIDQLYDLTSPSLEPRFGWAHRTGDPGLGRLTTMTGALGGGIRLGPGRLELSARGERLDAGAMTAASAQRFGVGPLTPGAPSLAKTAVSGASLEAAYQLQDLRAALGAFGFSGRPAGVMGELRWTPQVTSDLKADIGVARRPVTETLLAYAGTRDPRGGPSWGQVSRTGGHAGLTLTRSDAGAYAQLAAASYDGHNVRGNASVQLDVGGFARLLTHGQNQLTGGLNLDVQAYRHNEDAFTFGHGGYFSPQSFVAVSLPLRFTTKAGRWHVDARVSPGYQSYREGDTAVFPTAGALQAALPPGEAVFAGSHSKGFGGSAQAVVEYALGRGVTLGAEAGADTFGAYRETHALIRLRARFDGGK